MLLIINYWTKMIFSSLYIPTVFYITGSNAFDYTKCIEHESFRAVLQFKFSRAKMFSKGNAAFDYAKTGVFYPML